MEQQYMKKTRNNIVRLDETTKKVAKKMSSKAKDYVYLEGMLTGNRRNINTSSPKALLILPDDKTIGRTHCWIPINDVVDKMQPRGHNKAIKVGIEGKLVMYQKAITKEVNITVTRVSSIKRIKQ